MMTFDEMREIKELAWEQAQKDLERKSAYNINPLDDEDDDDDDWED